MATRIKMRRDSTSNWLNNNPVLADGELGIEQSNGNIDKIKIGDGVTAWNLLGYYGSGGTSASLENLENGFFKLTVGATEIYFPATTTIPT